MRAAAGKRRWQLILPGLYLLFAAYAWLDFTRIARDGLANVGLMIATLPVTLFGLLLDAILGSKRFVLMPDGFGYIGNHALYFVPAAAVTAALLWLAGRAIDRRRARE